MGLSDIFVTIKQESRGDGKWTRSVLEYEVYILKAIEKAWTN